MECLETPDGQIQADFARRVGQELLHYEAGILHARRQDMHKPTFVWRVERREQDCQDAISELVRGADAGR